MAQRHGQTSYFGCAPPKDVNDGRPLPIPRDPIPVVERIADITDRQRHGASLQTDPVPPLDAKKYLLLQIQTVHIHSGPHTAHSTAGQTTGQM